MTLPAVAVASAATAAVAYFFAFKHTPVVWQYSTPSNEDLLDAWGSWFLFLVLSLPVFGLVALASFLAHVRAGGWGALLSMRVSALAACYFSFHAVAVNMPDV